MRKPRIFIFIIFIAFTGWNVPFAQVSLIVSDTSACDTLNTRAFLSPSSTYDTISSISWILNDETIANSEDSITINLTEPGKYYLKALVNNNYEIHSSRPIYVFSSPDASFAWSDTAENNEFRYVFSAELQEPDTLTYDYAWRINNVLQGNLPIFSFSFTEANTYPVNLQIVNNAGCSASLTQNIRVARLLQCPNVFTPNMDTFNDVFQVNTDGISVYTFSVFSRTGIKVYYSESPTISWDGRSMSGIEMQPGIYYYTIEQKNGESPESISGFVHLIR
jgi:gliding motility-associated-like protein